ncbi:vWA domain-containing protein [Deinococcus ficus]|uniref:vWA domain-containing protein n=1 Tax=Deinococcus ficus TaxID=317577 RepID=UPI0003B605E7|nr:vWA domain-containing protein [Deinococcus ficus]
MRPTAALLLTLLLTPALTAHGQASTPTPTAAPCQFPPGPLPERTRAVFLLDTSGSMRGIGDGKANIFQAVKTTIDDYVHAQQPDRAVLVTFDNGVRSQKTFDAPATNPEWTAHLRTLSADGRNTHLYRSLQAALRPLNAADGYITTVFVLTDGIDNETPRTHTAQGALAAFTGRGPLDRLHYVALGTDIPLNARRALEGTTFADGLTLPVGRIPDLSGAGLEGGVRTVTDPTRIPVTFPDGTRLSVDATHPGVQLARPTVRGAQAALTLRGVPYGTPALLCAENLPALPGGVGDRSRRVLVRLNVGEAPRLTWLNPAADLTLNRGEHVILRYRAAPGVALDDLRVTGLPAGVHATLERLPGSREFSVRLQNTGLSQGQTATGTLMFARAPGRPLPTLTGGTPTGTVLTPGVTPPGRDAGPTRLTVPPTSNRAPDAPTLPAWLPWLLGALALLGAALAARPFLLRWWQARQSARTAPRPMPAPPPTIEGLEYTETRALSLVTAQGESMTLHAPLDGPFDIGHLARVPHLSGLRVQQVQGGLHLQRIPADLDVSQGARLLQAGDTVRPGTLLGLAVARPARAPHASLGDLAGLGLPLTIQADGVTVHLKGPYGQHALTLPGGVTDLGETLRSPALHGLRLGTSGPRILIVEIRPPLALYRPGDDAPLTPGTHLPATPTDLHLTSP